MIGAGRKLLITGGGGFLGAWIIRRLTDLGFAIRIFELTENRQLLRTIAGDVVNQRCAGRQKIARSRHGESFMTHPSPYVIRPYARFLRYNRC